MDENIFISVVYISLYIYCQLLSDNKYTSPHIFIVISIVCVENCFIMICSVYMSKITGETYLNVSLVPFAVLLSTYLSMALTTLWKAEMMCISPFSLSIFAHSTLALLYSTTCMSSPNFAKHTNLSQNNVIMVSLMSCRRLLRADRRIVWELHKRLSGIIIPCAIINDMRLIGKVDARADNVHII